MIYVNVSGIDLENIVYYKDDTHYFVMTAKKQSLLEKGVILQVNQRCKFPNRTSAAAQKVQRKEV